MACPFCNNRNGARFAGTGARVCPRTGRMCTNGAIQCAVNTNAVNAAATQAVARGEAELSSSAACGSPVGREIYGATSKTTVYTACTDACGGTRQYPIESRNPFWPTFAHPRWLTCNQLYIGRAVCWPRVEPQD